MLSCMDRLMAFARLLPDQDGGEEFRDQVELANDEVEELLSMHADESYLRLPTGIDGRVWHVGDEVDLGEYGHREVVAVNDRALYYWNNDESAVEWTQARTKRHWEPDTVEGLLGRLVDRVMLGSLIESDIQKLIDEYAEKLELKNG